MSPLTRRHFLQSGLTASAALTLPNRSARALAAIDEVNLGFISCGGRASELMSTFEKLEGVNIAGLCDPDQNALGRASERFPQAKKWSDLRELLEDAGIDAVVIATCNHWHCLAAIWAMEAGKDVYVEKPLSHSQWEGRQTVAAARRHNRVCQVGTQQRSDPMQAEIKNFLHDEKSIGNITAARVNRYGVRAAIGKRSTPLEIDKNVAYDLWLGPAQDRPIFRDKLQYDWHWDWNTGSGEMGNWGIHVLDDLRNNVFRDEVILPKRIVGGGGRVAWDDAGETPNVQFAYFDTGSIPVVIGLSNLPAEKGAKKSAQHPGPGSGYIAYCEGGRLEGQRHRAKAFDNDGNVVKEFRGNAGNGIHQQNFIDAVRAQDSALLNTEVEVGHNSTGWCNLANIAFRAGSQFRLEDARQRGDGFQHWDSLISDMDKHLQAHGLQLENDSIKLSPVLQVDVENERFVGDDAAEANRYLKREYRAGYQVMPQEAKATA